MKSGTLALRTALVTVLDPIVYNGKSIYSFEEYLQETAVKKKTIYDTFEAYIILLNQTQNDNSSKCMRNDEHSIQIQITTVFPAGKGGSRVAEEISEKVTDKLFTSDGLFGNIELVDPFAIWKMELESSRNINYNENASRTWITNLLVTASINQS